MAESSPPSWASYAHIQWQSRYQRLDDDSSADIAEYPRAFDYEQPAQTLQDERLQSLKRASQNKPLPPPPSFEPPEYVSNPDQDTKYIPLQNLSSPRKNGDDFEPSDIDLDAPIKPHYNGKGGWSRRCMIWWTGNFAGWRAGVMSAAMCSTVVFLINLITTIWATTAHGYDDDHRAVIFKGECARMRPLNTWIHLIINALSTVLLSSSNYCMQCLSAPTRNEVDWAHARNIWLDIGIPSFRNLRYIKRRRMYIWFILGASSLPLHLFYNSAVFASIAANSYYAITVSPDFVSSPNPLNLISTTGGVNASTQWIWDALRNDSPELEEITDVGRCIDAYAVNFVSNRADLVMVAKTANDSYARTILDFESNSGEFIGDTYYWMCDQDGGRSDRISISSDHSVLPCSEVIGGIKTNSSGWQPSVFGIGDYQVEKCYSRRTAEMCKLEFSLDLAITVIVLNALKAGAMFWLAFFVKDGPLMTMGDAVSSFVQRPDQYTRGMCMASASYFKAYPRNRRWGPYTLQYRQYPRRWFVSASVKRWMTNISMYCTMLLLVIILLNVGINGLQGPNDARAIGRLGLGQITPLAMISWDLPSEGARGLIANVLIANLAQPILSFIYFTYNGLFTCMFLAKEWASFGVHRKGLRVSQEPVGEQRSTYFLQLPYRYALPLMALSGILHWLVSQSIFLVSIASYDIDTLNGTPTLSTTHMSCGYSPLAIIFVVTLGLLMVITLLGMGWLRFKPGMPVVGSCSAAMSAACHQDTGEKGSHRKRLMWGVTRFGDANRPGHCAFSSYEVDKPVEWEFYAGNLDGTTGAAT